MNIAPHELDTAGIHEYAGMGDATAALASIACLTAAEAIPSPIVKYGVGGLGIALGAYVSLRTYRNEGQGHEPTE